MTAIKTCIALAVTAALLTACGGGGGDSGTPVLGGGTGTGGGGTGSGQTSPSMSLSLSSNTVTGASPAVVTATVVDASGNAVPGIVVSFTTGSLGMLSAPSALTDASGKAAVTLSPSGTVNGGADTVTATAEVNDQSLTAQAGYQLTATSVAFSSFTSNVPAGNSVSAYGQAVLNVAMSGVSDSSPVTLNFTSACVALGKAVISPVSAASTTGVITATYKDQGCGAVRSSDIVTASVAGTAIQSQVTLPLAQPSANSLTFVSATPETIYLKGSGYSESSTVKFKVVDTSGNPLPNQNVSLNLTTFAGGLTLNNKTQAQLQQPDVQTTDANGEVTAIVNSGTVPTPVRVTASFVADTGATVSTVSNNLSVAVGLPSQLNFSLSQATANIEGWNYDGTVNSYTIIAADRSGNPVPDGTAINFWAEGGQVHQSVQTEVQAGIARATSNFVSSSPRPADGRVTVVAYALGEESFVDLNGNNVYDTGEPFQDLGDIVKDMLFDNVFDTQFDEYFSLASAGAAGSEPCHNSTFSQITYNRFDLGADIPSRSADTCSNSWSQRTYVRRAIETVMSTSSPRLLWGNLSGLTTCTPITLQDTGPYLNSISKWNNYRLVRGDDTWFVGGAIGTLSFIVGDSNTYPANYQGRVRDSSGNLSLSEVTAVTAKDSSGSTTLKTFDAAGATCLPSGSSCTPLVGRLNPMPAGTVITAGATAGITVRVTGGSPVPSTTEASTASVQVEFVDASSGIVTVTVTTPKGLATPYSIPVTMGSRPTTGSICQ